MRDNKHWFIPSRMKAQKRSVHPTMFDRVVEALEKEFGSTNVFPHPDADTINIRAISANVVHSVKVTRTL